MKHIFAIASLLFTFQVANAAASKAKSQVVKIQVTEKGFEPEQVEVQPGMPAVLKITRTTDNTCAKQIKISSLHIKKNLPLNKTVSIDLGKLEKGNIAFACGEDMMTGHIIVQ
jgi:plastocyanin domain-containing protein